MSRFSRLIPRFLRGDNKSKGSVFRDGGSVEKPRDGPVCRILFLDDTDLHLSFKGSAKSSNLLEKVFDHLNLVEKDYFGLRFLDQSDQTHWLDPQKALSSQLKSCSQPYTLYFGVKFYPPDPCKLKEEITRYQFFLQIKRDILQGRLPITFDEAAELFAFAVQAEIGDYNPRICYDGYVSEFRFVPNQTQELEEQISRFHQHLGGMSPGQAEYKFLDKVKWLDMYGVDLHSVLGEGNMEYFLGLTPTGIVVYKNKSKVGNYFWPRITKVTFKGKIFIIKVKDKNNDEHTYAFDVATKTRTKHLWKCCVEHHTFFRINQLADTLALSSKQFRHGSRRSGRNDRQNNNDIRQQPSVSRIPSRRQPTRSKSDSRLNGGKAGSYYSAINDTAVTRVVAPEPVKGSRHRSLPDLQRNHSPRSTRSAPWEKDGDTGLYTSGRESPVSLHSDVQKFPKRVGQTSDTESGHRRKYFPKNKGSDNESDVSFSRRRRRDGDSGSESDVSPTRNRRPKSSVEPWYENHWKETMQGMFPANNESYMNGSVPSIHSAPAGEVKRRRRRRTKSPGTSKRPPEELKQHIVYDLVDTEGMNPEDLQDIPYVKVETKSEPFKIKYSPHVRQRYRSPKRRGFGDQDPQQLPQSGEPPPPYTPSESSRRTPELGLRNYMSDTNTHHNRRDLDTQSNKSGSTYRSSRHAEPSKLRNPANMNRSNGTPEQTFGQRTDSMRSQPHTSAGTAQYRVQSTKQETTSTNQSDDTIGPNSESVSDDTLEAIDHMTESNVATETEVKDRQPRSGSSGQRYNTSGYTSDVHVTQSNPRTSGYMSDVISSRSRNYQSNNPNVYKLPMTNTKVSNSPMNDISKVSQRYRVNENQSRNTPNSRQENSPYSRQENSPYSRRHNTENTSQKDYVSDVESSHRHRTPESPRRNDSHVSNYSRPPHSMYSVTPPSTAEVLRTDNSMTHKQNRSYVGQQYPIAPSNPEYDKRTGYKTSQLDTVNSPLNSSNLSSMVYNSSPYKQTTPSSVHIDKNQPSSVFSGNSPNTRLFSPQQVGDTSRQSTQENVSYSSSGHPAHRRTENNPQLYNAGESPVRGSKGSTSYNQGQSYAREDKEQTHYYDPRGPPGRQQHEHSPYGDRGRSTSRIGPDQQHYQGRSPSTAIQNYSAYNGHAGMPSRTDFTSANSSLNTSQFHSPWLGNQQSPSYSSPRKPYHPHLQASPRSGFSVPSHRSLNHSTLDASALRPVYRNPQRHDLVTEI
ncbi:serine/arginine repetitive matrix protein 2-like isoform X3 [Ostrea edulis]|uniref:serine/arginine repetitive matrix protein 2-like isoform X3 n=1 Tax=Ostrea edulis TaxID=37623 RepID=UPI002095FFF5|nr:serine/arginine repetitive matrix protein 2-like isoform X3 [Ostrea edulis]